MLQACGFVVCTWVCAVASCRYDMYKMMVFLYAKIHAKAMARVCMLVHKLPPGQWATECLCSMCGQCSFHLGWAFAHVIKCMQSWMLVPIVEVMLDGTTCSLHSILLAAGSCCYVCSPLGVWVQCRAPMCVVKRVLKVRARVSVQVCDVPAEQWVMECLHLMCSHYVFHSGRVFAHVIKHVRSWALVPIGEVMLDGTTCSLCGMYSAAGSHCCVCSLSGTCLRSQVPVCAVICL
jgi:hypothetical protein